MKYAFDLDGTISARPDVFGPLMKALVDAGHYVCVLTGALGPPGSIPEWRAAQLQALGLEGGTHFTECVIATAGTAEGVGAQKGHFCKSEGVALMVEDTDIYIDGVRANSPNTLCLRMR